MTRRLVGLAVVLAGSTGRVAARRRSGAGSTDQGAPQKFAFIRVANVIRGRMP